MMTFVPCSLQDWCGVRRNNDNRRGFVPARSVMKFPYGRYGESACNVKRRKRESNAQVRSISPNKAISSDSVNSVHSIRSINEVEQSVIQQHKIEFRAQYDNLVQLCKEREDRLLVAFTAYVLVEMAESILEPKVTNVESATDLIDMIVLVQCCVY